MRRHLEPLGFTLIEVTAALALTGLSVFGAVLLLGQLGDTGTRIRRESANVSAQGNGDRLLRELLRHAGATIDTNERFRGDDRSTSYKSWCARPAGWLERCDVVLAVDIRPDSSVIVAQLSTGEQLVLRAQADSAWLRYLDPSARDSIWVTSWGTSLTLPAAVALISAKDTVVYPVGPARD